MFHKTFDPPSPAGEPVRFARERAEYVRRMREKRIPQEKDLQTEPPEELPAEKPLAIGGGEAPESLARLLEIVSPEDSALIALIVFLLCDNTNNDVVLLGILLYILLSK